MLMPTSSSPAQLFFFPSGTPIHLITPYTVSPFKDMTSTIDPTSKEEWDKAWTELDTSAFNKIVPFFALRKLKAGMEWMRDTAFLFKPKKRKHVNHIIAEIITWPHYILECSTLDAMKCFSFEIDSIVFPV